MIVIMLEGCATAPSVTSKEGIMAERCGSYGIMDDLVEFYALLNVILLLQKEKAVTD